MADGKWTNLDAGPIQVKRFNTAWHKLNWEAKTYTELTGVIGEKERATTLTNLFGVGLAPRQDVDAVKKAIGGAYDWTVTKDNVNNIIRSVDAALPELAKTRPVKDERKSPEARDEQDRKIAAMHNEHETARAAQSAAFIAHYGSGETVTLRPGDMAVTATLRFNNSDSMTDYFDSHASLGCPDFVLLVAHKQAETERLARTGVARTSLLKDVGFEWHTEKYSMGHGNYLSQTGGVELPPELSGIREYYGGGGKVTHAYWEVGFTRAYSEPVTLPTIKGYGAALAPADAGPATTSVTVPTMTENVERGGVELRFPSKPAPEVLTALKAAGWRWNRFTACWYIKASDAAREFARTLTDTAVKGAA